MSHLGWEQEELPGRKRGKRGSPARRLRQGLTSSRGTTTVSLICDGARRDPSLRSPFVEMPARSRPLDSSGGSATLLVRAKLAAACGRPPEALGEPPAAFPEWKPAGTQLRGGWASMSPEDVAGRSGPAAPPKPPRTATETSAEARL